jgi:hypothetical protein
MANSPIQDYWHGIEYNDVNPIAGITIKRAVPIGDLPYARCVAIHLLTKVQNGNNHNIYMDVIDKTNKRLDGSVLHGRNNNFSLTATIDKPKNEAGTNFSVGTQDTYSVWVDTVPGLGKVVSDEIGNLATRWGGSLFDNQDFGHISFYILWMIVTGSTPPIDPVPPTGDIAALQAQVVLLQGQLLTLQTKHTALVAALQKLAKDA